MKLYCWPERTVHDIDPADVEGVVYALTAAYADALTQPDGDRQDAGHDAMSLLPCPLEVSRWARDIEMYAEHVEQGLESRVLGDLAADSGPVMQPGGVRTNDEVIALGAAAAQAVDAHRGERS